MPSVQPNDMVPEMEHATYLQETPKKERRKLRDVVCELGESCTLHGIPRIISSRHLVCRLMWILSLTASLVCCTVQLVGLSQEYLSYPKQTTISHRYSQLHFPALTFCNMNPIKQSSTLEQAGYMMLYYLENDMEILSNQFGDSAYQFLDRLQQDDYNVSDFQDFSELFKNGAIREVKLMKLEDRIRFGHQGQDFIQKASFAGSPIFLSDFTLYSSTTYGNCFTLDNTSFTAYGSGQQNGLKFIFNVEPMDYMTVFGSSYGIRMVLHEQGTYPLPEKDGVTIGAGLETNVGIRLTKFSRLDGKYGDCIDGSAFFKTNQLKYTVQLCQIVCESEYMYNTCGCYPLTSLDIGNDSTICNTYNATTISCMNTVYSNIRNGIFKCDCKERCKENVFTSTFSGSPWPHTSYFKGVLLKDVCAKKSSGFTMVCDALGNSTLSSDDITQLVEPFRDDFLSINIFFEDLNYELVAEEAAYPTVRFLSDIGGALGLYTGASILTYVELIQLVTEVVLHIRHKK